MSTVKSPVKRFLAAVTALTLALVVLVSSTSLSASAYSLYTAKVDNSTLAYDATITSTQKQWKQLADQEANEGFVLMKNSNNCLPIDTSKGNVKVNLLGYCGYNPVYSGAGSGALKGTDVVSFKDTLATNGFVVNPALEEEGVYEVEESDEGLLASIGSLIPSYENNEVSVDSFTGQASFANMKKYSDIAIMVIGRTGAEFLDPFNYDSKDGRRYLELSVNEEQILLKARATFDKVIVVINSANALEMSQLGKIGVDAIINVSVPGKSGLKALGKILSGKVNPSGRLVDTWLYDNDANPSSANFGRQAASNASRTYYLDYVEGIYAGYKFYETAYAEKAKITDASSEKTFDYNYYNSVVAYPFGYGLSYTSFSQKYVSGIPSKVTADSTFTVKVKVTNTGSVAGKEVVQLYVTVPYTSYDKKHGVEKAAVSLAGFGKTKKLQPGESQTVKIKVSMEDLASYDMSYKNSDGTKGAYRLDKGTYKFSIRSNAHKTIKTVKTKLKKNSVFTGSNKRSTDVQQAYNQFDDAARGTYLSRKNGFANYNSAMASVSSELPDTTFQDSPNTYNSGMDSLVTKHYKEGVDYGKEGGTLKYTDLAGKDYNDPLWDELLSQMTLDEMKHLTRAGLYRTVSVDSVGKPETLDCDGSISISAEFNDNIQGVSHTAIPVLGATFNKNLAYKYGQYVADEAHSMNVTSWYAPSLNMHRNAYAGRNYEYFSEDATLTATMGAYETLGARQKGLIVYAKHFAVNEMETNRGMKLHQYLNEQALREIYLKPFEWAVKKGHTNAIMGSCAFIGSTFASASEPLNTEVLRNEWGFLGMVTTDFCLWGLSIDTESLGPAYYWLSSTDSILRAGTDYWLDFDVRPFKQPSTDTDADIYYLMRACKDILYTDANTYVIPATEDFLGLDTEDGIGAWIDANL